MMDTCNKCGENAEMFLLGLMGRPDKWRPYSLRSLSAGLP